MYRSSITLRAVAAAVAAGLSLTAGQAALAQGASGEDSLALEEIVVTARRTEEKLLDVPLAISAFTAQDIEDRGIRNLDDVAANTPGLTFSNLQGEFLPVPVIRGVAPVSIFNENNAAIFVDGAFVSGREGLNFSQLDIERIEVLKGPQSAAYGRNAFSGAINYVTAKPTADFRAKAEVTLGSEDRRGAQLSVSGPVLGETLFGRIALLKDEWDGSYENQVAGGPDIGGYDFKTLQASLRWVPTDKFEGTLSVYLSDDQIDDSALSSVPANCENRNVADPMQTSRVQNYCGELPTVNADSLSIIQGATGEQRDLARVNLNLDWQVGGGQLTSITGYSNTKQKCFVDGSRGRGYNERFGYVSTPVIPIPGLNPGIVRYFNTGLLQIGPGGEVDEISEEIRFTSDEEKSLRYSVGAYYYSTDNEFKGDGVDATASLPADFYSFCPCFAFSATRQAAIPGFGDGAFLPWFTAVNGDAIYSVIGKDKTDAWSGFGYVEYDFASNWTARVEARWTDEEKEAIDVRGNRSVSDSWAFATWRATVDWKPAENWTIYASASQAQKSGGFDSANVTLVSNPMGGTVLVETTFDEEKLLSYEIGAKAELADGRIRLDGDIYFLDWSDVVLPQVLSEVNGQAIVTPTAFDVNAGDASILGVEAALEARISRSWRANFGFAWSDAEWDKARLDSFILFPSFAPTGDISGNKIQRQSKWQANAGLAYEAPISDNWGLFVRGDLAYRGKQFADNSNETIVPASTILNATIGLRGEHFSVELWGRNLTHEDAPSGAYRDVYFSNVDPLGTGVGANAFFPWRYTISNPRLTTYGLTARYRF